MQPNLTLQKLNSAINESNNIVVLTGAGISTPSGIKDFESIYSKKFMGLPPELILNHNFYKLNPKIFFEFVKQNLTTSHLEPNFAHKFLANLQAQKNVQIITQNIDGLHQMAGSKNVIELHGNINTWHCDECNKTKTMQEVLMEENLVCGKNNCLGTYRPNIALYNEQIELKQITNALNQIKNADLLLVIGTNLKTQLAYELAQNFNKQNLFIINKKPINCNFENQNLILGDVVNVFEELNNLKKQPKTK